MAESNQGRGIRSFVSERLQEADVPGAAIALLTDGEVTFRGSIGARDLSGSEPLDDNARFYIYSITKPLLAAITLQLVEKGTLALDEPVQTYLPHYPLATPVTIRQVLNHTAGLPDYGGMPEYAASVRGNPETPWTDAEFLERTLPRGLLFQPGAGWSYSNIGFLTIRLLLEQVTGQSLREIVAERICIPQGLTLTTVAESLADATLLTPGYSGWMDRGGPVVDVSQRYHPGWVSHGVVFSTALELARIIDAMFTGSLVPPALFSEMMAPVRVPGDHPPFVEPSYGLGIMLDPGSPHGVIAGHGGGGPGYSAGAFHVPNVDGRRVTSVALANSDRGDLGMSLALGLVPSVK